MDEISDGVGSRDDRGDEVTGRNHMYERGREKIHQGVSPKGVSLRRSRVGSIS